MDKSRAAYDCLILAGDVGGTNMNLALVGHEAGRYSVLAKTRYKTQEDSMAGRLSASRLTEALALKKKPEVCCLSLAGPVAANRCVLTNANLECDGAAIGARLGIECLVINDFTAISYGIALLDVDDPEQITKIPHADGSLPEPADDREGRGVVKAVGAARASGWATSSSISSYVALLTEGGHTSFPSSTRTRRPSGIGSRCVAVPPRCRALMFPAGHRQLLSSSRARAGSPDAEVARILAMPRDDWPRGRRRLPILVAVGRLNAS